MDDNSETNENGGTRTIDPPSTAHGNRRLTRQKLVHQLIGTFTSHKRTGRKRSLPIGTALGNAVPMSKLLFIFHTLRKISGRAKVCALCIEKNKKAPPGRCKQTTYICMGVIFHCAVWGAFWNTMSSEMWRCKIRQIGYYMHKFIRNKTKKEL